ncbi:hypothetical protein GCM10028895_41780 [Pontibacter rugosus]
MTPSNQFEKVSIIDALSIRSSYDFAKDSLKLAPISINLNTNLFKIITLNINSTFDPYKADSLTGRAVDDYYFNLKELKLARMTNASITLSASLSPETFRTETSTPTNLPALSRDQDPLVPEYVDFKIPWTLSVGYSLRTDRSFGVNGRSNLTHTVDMQGSLNITEKWKVQYMVGYDFVRTNISNANFQIHRDLHCWDMSIGWRPFGFQRGYNLTINARSALLQDLKLTKRSKNNTFSY